MLSDEGHDLFWRFTLQVNQLITPKHWQTKTFEADRFGDLLKVKLDASFFVVTNGGFWLEENHGTFVKMEH